MSVYSIYAKCSYSLATDVGDGDIIQSWLQFSMVPEGKYYSSLAKTQWFKTQVLGFSGGAVVKNPPTTEEDRGSSPGPGRAHMLRSN